MSASVQVIKEEALELPGQLRADLVFSPCLEYPEKVLICHQSSADAAEYFGVHVPVVVDRHYHEQSHSDPLEIRVLEVGAAPGRAADKYGLSDRAGSAVQDRDPEFRDDL